MSQIGEISKLGQRYLAGQLRQNQLQPPFQLSRASDIPTLDTLPSVKRSELLEIGRAAVAGRVAFGVLAAGASARMNPRELPAGCRQLLEQSGREPPRSKALVPVSRQAGRVLTFLDLFLLNVQEFRRRLGIENPAFMLTSEQNHQELMDCVGAASFPDLLAFQQPLAPQIAASPDDVRRARATLKSDYEALLRRAADVAGRDVRVPKPAGHGEFLHQLIESGMVCQLIRRGVECFSVRNIDNVAALLNDDWLALLGHFEQQRLDCLLEVCPRLPGQSGGALIHKDNGWQIAEDPSFDGTGVAASQSHYINNAVAIFRLSYLYQLYGAGPEQLLAASREELAEIADQGRRQFPVIVAAKRVLLDDGAAVAAMTPETNLWESTAVVSGARIGAFGVPSEQILGGPRFLELPTPARTELALRVRFSPTKTWGDYADPVKHEVIERIAAQLASGPAPS